jgi:hypothetical protein
MFQPVRVRLAPEDGQILWPKRVGVIFMYEVERYVGNKFTCVVFLFIPHTLYSVNSRYKSYISGYFS